MNEEIYPSIICQPLPDLNEELFINSHTIDRVMKTILSISSQEILPQAGLLGFNHTIDLGTDTSAMLNKLLTSLHPEENSVRDKVADLVGDSITQKVENYLMSDKVQNNLQQGTSVILLLVFMLLIKVTLIDKDPKFGTLLTVIGGILLVVCIKCNITSISKYIIDIMRNNTNENIVPQTGIFNIFDSIAMMFTAFNMSVFGIKTPAKIGVALIALYKSREAVEYFAVKVISLFEELINYFAVKFSGKALVNFMTTGRAEVDELREKTKELLLKVRVGEFRPSTDNLLLIQKYQKEFRDLIAIAGRDSGQRMLVNMLRKDMESLEDIAGQFMVKSSAYASARPEPVVVYLSGEPGVGKSMCMNFIARALGAQLVPPEALSDYLRNPEAYIHSQASDQKYWDGIEKHNIIIKQDDFMQATEAFSPENEALKMIQLSNTAPYLLNMANVDLKGNYFARPKVILLTGNRESLGSIAITSGTALDRRIDFRIRVDIKDDYCTMKGDRRTLDPEKLPKSDYYHNGVKEGEVSHYFPYANQFELIGPNEGGKSQRTGVFTNYDSLLIDIVKMVRLKEARHALFVQDSQSDMTEEDFIKFLKVKPQIGHINEFIISESSIEGKLEIDEQYRDCVEINIPICNVSDESLQAIANAGLMPSLTRAVCIYDDADFNDQCKMYERMHRYLAHESEVLENHSAHSMLAQIIYINDKGLFSILSGRYVQSTKAKSNYFKYIPKIPETFDWKTYYDQAKEAFFRGIRHLSTTAVWLFSFFWSDTWIAMRPIVTASLIFIIPALLFYFRSGSSNPTPESINLSDKMGKATVNVTLESSDKLAKASVNTSLTKSEPLKPVTTVTPQMGVGNSMASFEAMDSTCRKNMYVMSVKKKDDRIVTMGGVLFLEDGIALMPYHFCTSMTAYKVADEERGSETVCMRRFGTKDLTDEFSLSDFVLCMDPENRIGNEDLMLVNLSPILERNRRHKSIVDKFVCERDYANLPRSTSVVIFATDVASHVFSGVANPITTPIEVDGIGSIEPSQILRGWMYNASTTSGDCGAVITSPSNKRKGQIIGLHIAGCEDGLGYAVACSYELISDALTKMLKTGTIVPQGFLVDEKPSWMAEHHSWLGKVNPTPTRPLRSKIVQSKVFGFNVENTYAKSRLIPFVCEEGVVIDPLKLAFNLYGKPLIAGIDPEIVAKAKRMLYIRYAEEQIDARDLRVLSVREAIEGSEEFKNIRAIPRSTSAGYPMNITGNRNIKKELKDAFLNRDTILYEKILAEIEHDIEKLVACMKQGIRCEFIYTDVLKDEKLSKHKAKIGKTRMFSAGPFYGMILNKMYFGAAFDRFMSDRHRLESMVGGNPFTEWDIMSRFLLKFGSSKPNIGAGDYSRFDSTQLPQVHRAIFEILNGLYTSATMEEDEIRDILSLDVSNSIHLVEGNLVEWNSGLPSGSYMTIMVNTMYNQMNFRMAWLTLELPEEDFDNHVVLYAVGDDNIFSVSDRYREVFNESTLQDVMPSLGMIYTNETKGVSETSLRNLDQVEFLKRGFKFDSDLNKWIAPLRFEVVQQIPYYTKKYDSERITLDCINEALNESALHGKETFEKERDVWRNAMRKYFPGHLLSRSLEMAYESRKALVLNDLVYY